VPEMQARIPPPADVQTFMCCKLLDDERMADGPLVRLHRDLLQLRRDDPVLGVLGTDRVQIEASSPSEDVVLLRYLAAGADRLLIVNLGDDAESPMNDPLMAPLPATTWALLWSSEHPHYGGGGSTSLPSAGSWRMLGRSATLLGCAPV